MKLSVKLGRGLKFNGNKIALNVATSSLISVNGNGLYVGDLKGNRSTSSNTVTVDNQTIIVGNNSRLKANIDVVQTIISYDYRTTMGRNANSISKGGERTSLSSVLQDINAPAAYGTAPTSYFPQAGMFLLLKDGHSVIPGQYTEDGNRYMGQDLKALFYITSVNDGSRNGHRIITNITAKCLYSIMSAFTKGTEYSGSN